MDNIIDKAIELSNKVIANTEGIFSNLLEPRRKTEEFLYSIINDKGHIDEEDLKKAALMLNIRKIFKHLKNYYNILEKSNLLIENQQISDNNLSTPDDEWYEYFEDLSSKVSDNMMQEIWARLLTKERCDHGSISKVMLNTFAMLDKKSASAFGKLCRLTYKLNENNEKIRYIPLILYDDILHEIINYSENLREQQYYTNPFIEYQKFLPTQEEIEYLSEFNLLKISEVHDESEIYSHNQMKLLFSVANKSFETDSLYDNEQNYHFICTGQAFFTQTGLALYHALSYEPFPYLFDVLNGYINYKKNTWLDI